MNLKELLNGVKDVIVDAITSNTDTKVILENLNKAWPVHVEKIETIVEAISNERSANLVESAKTSFKEELRESYDESVKILGERVEAYCNKSYDTFVKDYEKNIISEAKLELVEKFVGTLKQALNENCIDIDEESKVNIESLTKKVDQLQSKLDESMTESIELKRQLNKSKFNLTLESVKSDKKLSEVQFSRLQKMVDIGMLSESVDEDKLKGKLEFMVDNLLTENTDDSKKTVTGRIDGVINEDVSNKGTLTEDKAVKKEETNPADEDLAQGLFQ